MALMTNPTFFGRYQLLDRIAQGGMAEVFLAQTVSVSGFEKELVIKRILPEFSGDPVFERMFVDEARIAAKLHHPNIVQVFDFDVADGSYYIAMEYIEGRDLSTIMETAVQRKESISLSECFYIIREVAKALDYAHRRQYKGAPLNIIHRDISPHNILISYDAAVKLTDFGIAKAASRVSKTREGVVKGKLAYMSPEQAKGEVIDQRSDLFSLGTIFHELVTLKKLFWGKSDREILLKVMNPNVTSPRSLVKDLPYEVEAIIMKLLQRKPANRYADAAALLSDLAKLAPQVSGLSAADLAWTQRMEKYFPQRPRRDAKRSSPSWPAASDTDSPDRPASITPVVARPQEPESLRRSASITPVVARPRDSQIPRPSRPVKQDLPPPQYSDDRVTEPTVPAAAGMPMSRSSESLMEPAPAGEPVQTRERLREEPPPIGYRRERTRPAIGHFRRQQVVSTDEQRSGTGLFRRRTVNYTKSDLGQSDPAQTARRKTILRWTMTGVAVAMVLLFALILVDPPAPSRPSTTGSSPLDATQEHRVQAMGDEHVEFDGTLILRSIPSGARVYMNQVILPERTPMSISLPTRQPTEFRLELDGFPSHALEVTLTDSNRPVERLIFMGVPPER